MATPDAFLNPATVSTFAGATTGVVAVGVLFRRAFAIHSLAIPAITSYIVTGVLAVSDGSYKTAIGLLIVFLNGAMLFCSSIGMNETLAAAPPPPSPPPSGADKAPAGKGPQTTPPAGPPRMRPFQSYFRATTEPKPGEIRETTAAPIP